MSYCGNYILIETVITIVKHNLTKLNKSSLSHEDYRPNKN